MNKRILLFLEKVISNSKQTQGYALPNGITDTNDQQALVDIIENDPELFKMAYAVDPGYNKVKAIDIWNKIAQNPDGKAIIDKYQDILHYRISSARTRGDGMQEGAYDPVDPNDPETTRPIDLYDQKANTASTDIGSFYDFFTSIKHRPNEVSGGSTKDRPLQ
jgi:hypothetical protein